MYEVKPYAGWYGIFRKGEAEPVVSGFLYYTDALDMIPLMKVMGY